MDALPVLTHTSETLTPVTSLKGCFLSSEFQNEENETGLEAIHSTGELIGVMSIASCATAITLGAIAVLYKSLPGTDDQTGTAPLVMLTYLSILSLKYTIVFAAGPDSPISLRIC